MNTQNTKNKHKIDWISVYSEYKEQTQKLKLEIHWISVYLEYKEQTRISVSKKIHWTNQNDDYQNESKHQRGEDTVNQNNCKTKIIKKKK